MAEYFIGLMSGTSMDSIDAALVDFSQSPPKLVCHYAHDWPSNLLRRVKAAAHGAALSATEFAHLDSALGAEFASACLALLKKAKKRPEDIIAIGSHGQTLAHSPDESEASSLQLGDPNIICEKTNIDTVADLRRRDVAAGGQGAPLVPAFHAQAFPHNENIVVLNIGGIANITILSEINTSTKSVIGFDTGPGNCLMDEWHSRHHASRYDHNGHWAGKGQINSALLQNFLDDPYFAAAHPKSTGIQYFSTTWLGKKIEDFYIAPEDIQATLCELSAISITRAIKQTGFEAKTIAICGGGVHNLHLLLRLQQHTNAKVVSTENYGLAPDWVEAIAFAWLAKQRIDQMTGNLAAVTGSRGERILGGLYLK